MIINSLFTFLKTEIQATYPAYGVYKGSVPSTIKNPREFIIVNETSGNSDRYPSRFVKDIQIVIQSEDLETARSISNNVFNVISERYNFEIIPDILARPTDLKISIAQIKAKSDPIELGETSKGCYQFSINYEVIGNLI